MASVSVSRPSGGYPGGACNANCAAIWQIILATVGGSHQLAGVAYNALAGVQHDRGELADAEANFRRALDIFSVAAGEQHPHMLTIHGDLARLLLDRGALEAARAVSKSHLRWRGFAAGGAH